MFNIRRLEDININEVQLKSDYYNQFINGNIENAHQIIEDNPNLKFKVLNSENLNNLISSILNLENYYFNNVIKYLDNQSNIYQINIDDLIYLEEYKKDKQYEINNFVSYKNEIYYCYKKPQVGIVPTNNLYWICLGLRGEKMRYPLSVKYKGYWNSETEYNKYDMTIYENKIFIAQENNINKIPSESLEWVLSLHVEEQNIFISDFEPPNIKKGDIWIQILNN